MNDTITEVASEERIVDTADLVFHERGVMPLPLNEVASRAGVSRSLIYAHFPSQHELINAVIRKHLRILKAETLLSIPDDQPFSKALDEICEHLFRHFVDHGTILFQAWQDDYIRADMDTYFISISRRAAKKFGNSARTALALPPRTALATIDMLSAIPEELAKLVRTKQISFETGLNMLHRATRISINALAIPERRPRPQA